MGASTLLQHLRLAGFELRADADRLLVQPASALTADAREAIRRHKTELLELLAPTPEATPGVAPAEPGDEPRRCTHCTHLSRVGTCREPVSTGLLSSFEIVWPEAERAEHCPAFEIKPPQRPLPAPGHGTCESCMHLLANPDGGWSCRAWRQAGVGRDLPEELVRSWQRCPAFRRGAPEDRAAPRDLDIEPTA